MPRDAQKFSFLHKFASHWPETSKEMLKEIFKNKFDESAKKKKTLFLWRFVADVSNLNLSQNTTQA